MPYRRYSPYRRRPRTRRYRRRTSTAPSTLSSIAQRAALRMIKMYVNTERKYFDTSYIGGVDSTAPDVFTLNNMIRGTDDINRIGNQVKIMTLQAFGRIEMDQSIDHQAVRMIIGVDMQPNGANPSIGDVIESNAVTALRQKDTGRRFHILYDKLYQMDKVSRASSIVKFFKKNLQLKVEYDANTGTVADISTNNLFVIMTSDQGTTTLPQANLRFRIRYIDN